MEANHGHQLASRSKRMGRNMAGSRFPTFTYVPNTRLNPRAKMRMEPMKDICEMTASLK